MEFINFIRQFTDFFNMILAFFVLLMVTQAVYYLL